MIRRLRHWKPPEANTIAALATVVAALATAGLWLATRNLVATARDTEKRQLRAYVYVGVSPTANFWQNNPDGSSLLTVTPISHVLGATPAATVWYSWYLQVMPATPHGPFPFIGIIKHSGDDSSNPVEAPGQDYQLPTKSLTLSPSDKEAVERGTKIIIAEGKITYTDVFGEHDWTEFCWLFNWHEVANSDLCPRHNDADWSGHPYVNGVQFTLTVLPPPHPASPPHSSPLPPRGFGVPRPAP